MAKEWRIPGIFKADVEKVDSEIKDIANGAEVTPSDLVEYARDNDDSELHKCFEWDDGIAAEKYRISQAQKILRFIITKPDTKDKPAIREYSISTERNVYRPTRSFILMKDEYESLLSRAIAELKAFEQKYKSLAELDEIFAVIDEL